ncbi:MAG: DUF4831 family protein [Bacteroidaceae bacterium]|nr:DUF4831 family protein [Bacteroidaceae bacterium]
MKVFSILRHAILISAGILFSSYALAQTQVSKFVPGSTLEGVNYFLPRTAFRIVITTERTVVTPGKYHEYAYKFLRIVDTPIQASTTWCVKDIKIIPFSVPDNKKAYSIKLKGNTIAPMVSMTKDGILLGINAKVEETFLPETPRPRVLTKAVTYDDVQKYMNRDMLQAGSDAKMAELVAQEIYDIRESRDALLRGEADNTPKDGQQLKLMLDGLEEQIKTLTSLFVGTKEVSEVTYVKDIVPNATTEKFVAFRFSKWSGMVDSDDMSGAPYYISIEKMGDLPEPSEDVKIAAQKGKMLTAVRYNVPARTKTKVYNAEKTFVEFEYPIAQFGYEEILSNVLFDKKATTSVTFFQHTGGIKNIKEGSAQ